MGADIDFDEELKDINEGIFREVETEEWTPNHKPLDYPKGLIKWIDSINNGWRHMISYDKFDLWRMQAMYWLEQTEEIEDYYDEEDQQDFIDQEQIRCRDNSLYFCNKYGKLKEGDAEGGGIEYQAWKAQEICLFLFDCGYNLMIGKPRQIGFTSTLGLASIKRINFNPSYFVKFITHTKDKGEEIYRDKIRWAFGKLPDWFRQNVYNDSHSQISLLDKSVKGSTSGANARLEVVTPKIDAINGGAPNLTLIDEVGLIEILTKMMNEGRPTLFFYNPKTQQVEMKRQIICWGTGGEMDKGGAVFEIEFKATMHAWKERNFKYGIIPIFFDAFAREGMTAKQIAIEKEVYYSKTGAEAEVSKVQFHQHYPMTIDDMFLRTANTIIPIQDINKNIVKIYQLDGVDKPQYGFFEPILDTNKPTEESDLPFKLIGTQWMPTKGMSDERTTTVIFRHPEKNWLHRYYQGTDPINSETGHSLMSSAIWDAYAGTCSAVTNWRVPKYKECYLQCMMLGMYYGHDGLEAKELVESNIGDGYVDYKEMKGFNRNLQSNAVLPPYLQTPASKWWGISNRTNTGGRITQKTIEMVDSHADNIYIQWFWIQLKTFVEKSLKGGGTNVRQTRFQAADMKYDYDDVIFSMTFAYINAISNVRFEPHFLEAEEIAKPKVKYVQSAETGYKLRLAEVNAKGKIIRYIHNR